MVANAQLPPPRTIQGKPSGEWVVFDDVPVFDEHTGPDGVRYTPKLLQRIAQNCNDRIRDTGDYCAVVIGHTPDPDDPKAHEQDPPVIGFAGPFVVQQFGQQAPRAAIHARFWVYREDADKFKRYPRRSVEIWPEESPDQRYFDPIALLGAETPKRDLGIVYSKPRGTAPPHRYSAVFASGTNTFAPTGKPTHSRVKPQPNAKDSEMPFSPQDLNQLVEAITPVIDARIDEAIGMQGPNEFGDDPGAEAGPPAAPPEPAAAPAAPPEMSDDDMAYGKGLARHFSKYAKENDEDGGAAFLGGLGEDDKYMRHYMKYACESDEDKQFYAKVSGEDISGPEDEMSGGAATQYSKARGASFAAKYRKAAAENAVLKQRLAKAEGQIAENKQSAQKNSRLATLSGLAAEGYAFDPEQEYVETESFSDEQFEHHCEHRVPYQYAKATTGRSDMFGQRERPGVDTVAIETGNVAPSSSQTRSQKYSRRAMLVCTEAAEAGKTLDYGEVLANVKQNNGEYIPTRPSATA